MRKLRILTLLLLLTLALSALTSAQWGAWAEPARDYVVDAGLMTDENPTQVATRAQLAAVLTNYLGCETMADLSDYDDVDENAWYYEPMAKAVSFGVFQGANGHLNPNGALTRQEAMVAMSRVFGYWEYTTEAMTQFPDCYTLPVWAWNSVTPLVNSGIVNGKGDNLCPLDTLTRQEMAQLMYTFDQSANLTIYHHGDNLGSTIDGNLMVVGEEVKLSNKTIKGTLFIGGNTHVTLSNTSVDQVKTFGPDASLTSNRSVDITVLSGDLTVDSNVGTLVLAGDCTVLDDTVKSAMVYGKTLAVRKGATVQNATLVTKSTITGEGYVSKCTVQVPDCMVETKNARITNDYAPDLSAITMTMAPVQDFGPTHMTTNAVATFHDLPTEEVTMNLVWYCDGKVVETQNGVTITEGEKVSHNFSLTYAVDTPESSTLALKAYCGTQSYYDSQTVSNHLEYSPVAKVETLEILATANYDATVFSSVYLSGYVTTIKKGDVVVYDDYSSPSTYHIVLPDGRKGFVSRSALTISTADFVQYTDYSTPQKEYFVKQKGYTSPTNLLIWVSLKTQKVNVFSGGNGNWKLLHTFPCCSGKNMNPTEPGVHNYDYRNDLWDFGHYVVYKPMIFQGGHAFHTRTYIKGTNQFLDATMGKNVSQGCIRMLDNDVTWLWNNMKVGTTVVVY